MAYFHLFGNVTISVQSRGWTHQAHAHGGAMGIRDKILAVIVFSAKNGITQ